MTTMLKKNFVTFTDQSLKAESLSEYWYALRKTVSKQINLPHLTCYFHVYKSDI